MSTGHLLALLQLSDPTLPIGGFAHSSGLETYVQQRALGSREDAEILIRNLLSTSLHHTDGALASLAFDAAGIGDSAALLTLCQECDAAKPVLESRLASRKLGLRLLKLFTPLCNDPLLAGMRGPQGSGPVHYCVVYGTLAALLNIPKLDALSAFYYNAAAALVTNSVKLVPLGQQEGQELLFSLKVLMESLAQASMVPDHSLVGLSTPGADIRGMQHQYLYSRLYMS